MNREEIAVARRRQEALDSLEFEREREEALTRQLEPVIRDAEAWRADAIAFEGMPPEDVETLRRIGFATKEPPEDARGRFEARIAELAGDDRGLAPAPAARSRRYADSLARREA